MKTIIDDHGASHEEIIVLDGVGGWHRQYGVIRRINARDRQEVQKTIYSKRVHQLFPLLEESRFVLKVIGESEVQGTKTIGVRVSSVNQSDIDLYFDKKNWLLVKKRELYTGEDGQREMEIEYSNYKRIDGVTCAAKETWYVNGQKRVVQEFVEIKFLKSMPPKESEAPLPSDRVRATEALQKGHYAAVIRFLSSHIQQNPKDVIAYVDRGIAYGMTRRGDEAMRDYEKAIELDPRSPFAFGNRGNLWRERGEYDKALRDLDMALQIDPGMAGAYYNRALVWEGSGKPDKAIADFNEAEGRGFRAPELFRCRGRAWSDKNDYDRAIGDYTAALEANPLYAEALRDRGFAWECKGCPEKAVPDYDAAIRLNPRDAMSHNNRGNIRKNMKQYAQALPDFEKAVELDPRNAVMRLNRGTALENVGRYDDAITEYEQTIKLDPKSPSGYSAFAWLSSVCPKDTIRNGKKAVQTATKACELSRWKDATALEALAAAEAECGNFKEAAQRQQQAITLGFSDNNARDGAAKRLDLYLAGKCYRK
ncbi:MAG TPA: tetratricopeptide repeat protein [Gemmataceae bacterium]|nr:tetratricopeptide repeat protein [Gemmataceae bacterium]